MTRWQRFKLLCKLNWSYFKAVLTCKDPVLTTKDWGTWYLAPESVRQLSFEFEFVKFWASVNNKAKYIEIPLEEVIGINIINIGGDKDAYS